MSSITNDNRNNIKISKYERRTLYPDYTQICKKKKISSITNDVNKHLLLQLINDKYKTFKNNERHTLYPDYTLRCQ